MLFERAPTAVGALSFLGKLVKLGSKGLRVRGVRILVWVSVALWGGSARTL